VVVTVILASVMGCDEAPAPTTSEVSPSPPAPAAETPSVPQTVPPTVPPVIPPISERLPDRLDLVGCAPTGPLTGACRAALVDLARSGRPVWVDRALLTDAEHLSVADISDFYGFPPDDPRLDTMLAILASQCLGGMKMPEEARRLSAGSVLEREDCSLDALPTLSALGITMHSIGPGLTSQARDAEVAVIRTGNHLSGGPGPGYGFRLNLRFSGPTGLAQEEWLERLGGVSVEAPLVIQVGEIFQPVEPGGELAQPVVACEEGLIDLTDGRMTAADGGPVEGFCGAPGVSVPSDEASWSGTGLQVPMADCTEEARAEARAQLSAPVPSGGLSERCPHEIWADCDGWARERVEAEFGDLIPWQERRCALRMERAEVGFSWRLVCSDP
jgi:hypothetical protein